MTRSRRSMCGGNSSLALLLPAGFPPRSQTPQQFRVPLFVRLRLGGDDLLLLRAGRLGGLVETQMPLIGRFVTALAPPPQSMSTKRRLAASSSATRCRNGRARL